MATKEELLQKMSDMVFEMEDEEIADVCEEYIEAGYEALDGILHGLVDGMNRASEMYDQEEYFVTDLLLCSDAMYAGLDVLRPHLPEDASVGEAKKAVIGVVEGDTHDIGKNLVKIMMETAGFEMFDLGRDVPLDNFVEKSFGITTAPLIFERTTAVLISSILSKFIELTYLLCPKDFTNVATSGELSSFLIPSVIFTESRFTPYI